MVDLPVPEPTEKDEELALQLEKVKSQTNLRGVPNGDERCDNCHFYEDPDQGISFCWHDELKILAGAQWWCDRWEEIGASDEAMTPSDRTLSMTLRHETVDDNVLINEPKYGERCDGCLYYLNPDDTVSYCWHPKVRALVGEDWWCQWWEEIPGT